MIFNSHRYNVGTFYTCYICYKSSSSEVVKIIIVKFLYIRSIKFHKNIKYVTRKGRFIINIRDDNYSLVVIYIYNIYLLIS